MRFVPAVLVALVPAAVAQETEIQRELIRRDQQSDAFRLKLRQSQEQLEVPAAGLSQQQAIEARHLGERQRLDLASERQLLEIGPQTPDGLRPYERERMRRERLPLAEPSPPPDNRPPELPRPLPLPTP